MHKIMLLILMALGLSQIYMLYSGFFVILEFFGISYICYIGYKITTSKASLEFGEYLDITQQNSSKNRKLQIFNMFMGFILIITVLSITYSFFQRVSIII